jgi:hypothetical protein
MEQNWREFFAYINMCPKRRKTNNEVHRSDKMTRESKRVGSKQDGIILQVSETVVRLEEKGFGRVSNGGRENSRVELENRSILDAQNFTWKERLAVTLLQTEASVFWGVGILRL